MILVSRSARPKFSASASKLKISGEEDDIRFARAHFVCRSSGRLERSILRSPSSIGSGRAVFQSPPLIFASISWA